jgi:signal transduction histidine kinase
MSANLVRFRGAPEDATTVMARSRRRDEIGVAQRELRVMQQRVRAALRQKARLASVGAAVSKINHDLRNMLATALVVSDRLALTEDPETRKVSAPLLAALERAINLCTQTLSFASAEEPDAPRGEFPLWRRWSTKSPSSCPRPSSTPSSGATTCQTISHCWPTAIRSTASS